MNTTTPAELAGVAARVDARGLSNNRRTIPADWACLPLVGPVDPPVDAAATYAELGLHVIPDPARQESAPLPNLWRVLQYWQQSPDARVGLLTGTRFDALAVRTHPVGRFGLQALAQRGVLDGCFGQIENSDETYLLFAPSGRTSQRVGLAPQGVRFIGTSGRIDVTPAGSRWLFVETDRYGAPVDLDAAKEALA